MMGRVVLPCLHSRLVTIPDIEKIAVDDLNGDGNAGYRPGNGFWGNRFLK